jgi:hypothetical protein
MVFGFLSRGREETSRLKHDLELLKNSALKNQEWVTAWILHLNLEITSLKNSISTLVLKQQDGSPEVAVRRLSNDIHAIAELSQMNRRELDRLKEKIDEINLQKSLDNLYRKIIEEVEARFSLFGIKNKQQEKSFGNSSVGSVDGSVRFGNSANFENLRLLEKRIIRCILVSVESVGKNLVPSKQIAFDLFPNKSYAQVKSTVSQYIGYLQARNIITKSRIGRGIFISLTPEALKYLKGRSIDEYLKKIEVSTNRDS